MSEQAGGHGLGALTHLVPDDATVRVLRDLAFDLAREAGELGQHRRIHRWTGPPA